jgi:CHAT domain-containing protein
MKAAKSQEQPENNVLIVGIPETPGKNNAIEAAAETKAIERIAESAARTVGTNLDYPSKAGVLENLPSYSIVHFAYHGVTESSNPSNNHLLLAGRVGTEADPLTVKELSSSRNLQPMLAYLSACNSANHQSKKLLDEVIQIASGFQLAGFPHVIGTLWEANDQAARGVATEFYKNLFDSLGRGQSFGDGIVSQALYDAVGSLRENFEGNPILWAPLIHLGARHYCPRNTKIRRSCLLENFRGHGLIKCGE